MFDIHFLSILLFGDPILTMRLLLFLLPDHHLLLLLSVTFFPSATDALLKCHPTPFNIRNSQLIPVMDCVQAISEIPNTSGMHDFHRGDDLVHSAIFGECEVRVGFHGEHLRERASWGDISAAAMQLVLRCTCQVVRFELMSGGGQKYLGGIMVDVRRSTSSSGNAIPFPRYPEYSGISLTTMSNLGSGRTNSDASTALASGSLDSPSAASATSSADMESSSLRTSIVPRQT